MPYHWTETSQDPVILTLTAHNSLQPKGFVLMIGLTVAFIALPLLTVLGTAIVWVMLPFFGIAVGALWFALRSNQAHRQITEVLRRDDDELTLSHTPAKGAVQSWSCNVYWAKAHVIVKGGPVDHYVTLSGNGREVEIGSFLSEDERKALFKELSSFLQALK
ncbi:DUF2244 domain-containing protein [Cognatishimia activa]|nr:DUF2244 domain-containing protein [Cognatishimia activa]